MLVLTRKMNETIQIGDQIQLTVLRIKGNTVRIGIEAPADVRVRRGEIPPKSEFAEMTIVMSDESQEQTPTTWQIGLDETYQPTSSTQSLPESARREIVQLSDIVKRVRQTPLRTLKRAIGAE